MASAQHSVLSGWFLILLVLISLVLDGHGYGDQHYNVEDLKHFVLECPVYDSMRSRCSALPATLYAHLDDPDCMLAVFGHEDQTGLARTLYKMKVHRARMLNLPYHMWLTRQ